jgi:hypothetical protein
VRLLLFQPILLETIKTLNQFDQFLYCPSPLSYSSVSSPTTTDLPIIIIKYYSYGIV